jgi:hypothetical protein
MRRGGKDMSKWFRRVWHPISKLVSNISTRVTNSTYSPPGKRQHLSPIHVLELFDSIKVPYDTLGAVVIFGSTARDLLAIVAASCNRI